MTTIKKIAFIFICVLVPMILTGCGDDKITTKYENGIGEAVFDGVRHEYILDLPSQYKGAPLVVMLHGYGGNAEAFRSDVAFEAEANASGYAVVYVTGAPRPEDPTASTEWNSGIGMSSNDDVGFICALVEELCDTYDFDKEHVYAIGFSNGAFMVHRLAVETENIFDAVVSVAGTMTKGIWEARPSDLSVGVLQITGEKDDVVPKNMDGSAKYSQAPAIEDVLEYYVDKNGLTLAETYKLGNKSVINKYSDPQSSKQVWDVFVADGRHSWPQEDIVGFDANKVILDFLDASRQK